MSEIRVNNITNRDGTAGPSIAGIPVVDSNSHFVVPTGRTGQRYADGGENIVRDGLVLYLDAKYSYPGATGTNPDVYTWYDMSGNGNDGELVSGVEYSSSNGGSLVFDGVDDYAKFGSTITPSNISVSVWFKTNIASGYKVILDKSSSWYLFLFDGAPQFFINGDSNSALSSTTLTSNVWFNVTGTYDQNKISIYINGLLSKNTNYASPIVGNNFNIELFSRSVSEGKPNNYLTIGSAAQVSIYNRALTASEVSQNFEALRSRFGI